MLYAPNTSHGHRVVIDALALMTYNTEKGRLMFIIRGYHRLMMEFLHEYGVGSDSYL